MTPCISIEGWKLLYVIGLIEALIFCGLGWLLSGFTVRSYENISMHIHNADFVFHPQLLYAAMNLTTNEMFNYKRYNYLKNGRTGKYHNPYSRGIFYNLAEFFLCVEPLEGEPIPDNSEATDDNELI